MKAEPRNSWPEGLWRQLMSDTEGLLAEGSAESIEHDLTAGDLGRSRRQALAYLEQSFGESLHRMMTDREHAVAIAQLSRSLSAQVRSYETLLQLLKAARTRMLVELAKHPDMDEVIAESDRLEAAARPH